MKNYIYKVTLFMFFFTLVISFSFSQTEDFIQDCGMTSNSANDTNLINIPAKTPVILDMMRYSVLTVILLQVPAIPEI